VRQIRQRQSFRPPWHGSPPAGTQETSSSWPMTATAMPSRSDADEAAQAVVRPPRRPRFRTSPKVSGTELNRLYASAWPHHRQFDFSRVLRRSLGWICAYDRAVLVGFVYLAWDGAQHAFLLEPTVRPRYRRRGIGKELVRRAVDLARRSGCEWVHVDWEARLTPFYRECGFRPTKAGLIRFPRPARPPRGQ